MRELRAQIRLHDFSYDTSLRMSGDSAEFANWGGIEMIDKSWRERLSRIVGEAHVFTSPLELQAYSYDATPMQQHLPDGVVMPGNTQEVAEILKWANTEHIPVVPRGSGTNLAGGTVPMMGGIVLSLSRFNRILEIDPQNLTVTLQPGVITADLHQAVEELGLFYPPDPSSMKISTIGGNVAQGAGGIRGLKYGVTKDYVLGLECVLPTGEILRSGGKNVKDVAGYDLTRLLVGSEGTLAVLTEFTLKLVPLPETKQTAVVYCRDLVDAAHIVQAIIAAHIIPATMEFLDQTTLRVVDDFAHLGLPRDMGALLLIEQDGSETQVRQDMARMVEIALDTGAVSVKQATDPEEVAQLVSARRSALAALARMRPTTVLEDATVPRSRLAEMVKAIQQIAQKYALQIGTFGHAGDGNLHPTCMTDERDVNEIARVEQAFAEIFQTALDLGGTLTGEHGVGIAKRRYLPLRLGADGMALMRRIKTAFDPNGILNPGKMFPVDGEDGPSEGRSSVELSPKPPDSSVNEKSSSFPEVDLP